MGDDDYRLLHGEFALRDSLEPSSYLKLKVVMKTLPDAQRLAVVMYGSPSSVILRMLIVNLVSTTLIPETTKLGMLTVSLLRLIVPLSTNVAPTAGTTLKAIPPLTLKANMRSATVLTNGNAFAEPLPTPTKLRRGQLPLMIP